MPPNESLQRLEKDIDAAIRTAKNMQLELCAHILAMAKLELLSARLQKQHLKLSEKKPFTALGQPTPPRA